MTGKENLESVLALVDVTKVDLPSYNISVKKYDEIARAYTKMLFMSSILYLCSEDGKSDDETEQKRVASETAWSISQNPLMYAYEYAFAREGELVQRAAEEVYGHRLAETAEWQVLQKSTKRSLMIRNLKHMLEMLSEFAETHSDDVLEFCMSEEKFEHQLALFAEVKMKKTTEIAEKDDVEKGNAVAQADANSSVSKKPFWKRIFCRS